MNDKGWFWEKVTEKKMLQPTFNKIVADTIEEIVREVDKYIKLLKYLIVWQICITISICFIVWRFNK